MAGAAARPHPALPLRCGLDRGHRRDGGRGWSDGLGDGTGAEPAPAAAGRTARIRTRGRRGCQIPAPNRGGLRGHAPLGDRGTRRRRAHPNVWRVPALSGRPQPPRPGRRRRRPGLDRARADRNVRLLPDPQARVFTSAVRPLAQPVSHPPTPIRRPKRSSRRRRSSTPATTSASTP